MRLPKVGSLVLVWWDDARSQDGWAEPGDVIEVMQSAAGKCKNVGWLQEVDDQAIYMASAIDVSGAGSDRTGGLWRIPFGMIVKVSKLAEIKAKPGRDK